MALERIVHRYTAYYAGWCVAFGEHEIDCDEEREIHWIFGEGKAGITLAPGLRRRFIRELLGHHGEVPEITLYKDAARINRLKYRVEHPYDLEGLRSLRDFLQSPGEIHMFLTSHFCYPQGTRIITFSKKKPLIIMYKEIDPLRLRVV